MMKTLVKILGLSFMSACTHVNHYPASASPTEIVPNHELVRLNSRIKELELILNEKEALIQQQNKMRMQQIETQESTSSEVSQMQFKMQRLATKPSTASMIAETEVALQNLKPNAIQPNNLELKKQAEFLLEAAVTSFQKDEYVLATSYAMQAYEIVNMIQNQGHALVMLAAPITLSTKTNVNLRRNPDARSTILQVLGTSTWLTANAYQGNWLRVQTENEKRGWVHNSLVEARVK